METKRSESLGCVTEAAVNRYWGKLQRSEGLFVLADGWSFEWFREVLLTSKAVFEYPFGIARITESLDHKGEVEAHLLVWSKEVFPSFYKLREDLEWVRENLQVERVVAKARAKAKALGRVLEAIGFKKTNEQDLKMTESGYVVFDRWIWEGR